jgi:hypothetical protein
MFIDTKVAKVIVAKVSVVKLIMPEILSYFLSTMGLKKFRKNSFTI